MADTTYTPRVCPHHGKPLDHLVVYEPKGGDGQTLLRLLRCADCPIVQDGRVVEVHVAPAGTNPWDMATR